MSVSCLKGYEMQGPGELTCTVSGEWSGAVPKCVVGLLSEIVSNSSDIVLLFPNSFCLLPASCPLYDIIGSHRLVDIIYSPINDTSHAVLGAIVSFHCQIGYKLIGNPIAMCNDNSELVPFINTHYHSYTSSRNLECYSTQMC